MSSRFEEDPSSKKLLASHKESVRARALEVVLRTFPQKVVSLDKMIKSDPRLVHTCEEIDAMFRKDLAESRAKTEALQKEEKEKKAEKADEEEEENPTPASAKKRRLEDKSEHKKGASAAGSDDDDDKVKEAYMTMPSNKLIVESIEILRAELLAMVSNVDTVKLWIQLNIPRIEDGNNFGVSVQEDMVSELSRAEDNAFSLLETMTKYYVARAKLVTRCFKYPKLSDFEAALSEIDQKQYLNSVLSLVDLRNNYALLYDMIIKNIDKLENPRGSEHMSHLF